MAYYDFLNILFAPLLKLPPLWAIITISFIISFLIMIITKYTTDQALMKRLKEELKEYQRQMKELKNNPAKTLETQKKSMEINMKYMMHSFRPTLITFIPIILIFGWMSSTFAYQQIKPQQEFNATILFAEDTNGEVSLSTTEGLNIMGNKIKTIENSKATWALEGVEGEHILEFDYNGEKRQGSVLITNEIKYIDPNKKITNSAMKLIQISNKKLVVMPIGYKDWLGWLGTYIIFSIIFTMALRKFMKVY